MVVRRKLEPRAVDTPVVKGAHVRAPASKPAADSRSLGAKRVDYAQRSGGPAMKIDGTEQVLGAAKTDGVKRSTGILADAVDGPATLSDRLAADAAKIADLADPTASTKHPSLALMLPALAAGHAKPGHAGRPPRSVPKEARSYFHFGRALALEKVPLEDVHAFVITGKMSPRMQAVQDKALRTGSHTSVNASRAVLNVGIAAARVRKGPMLEQRATVDARIDELARAGTPVPAELIASRTELDVRIGGLDDAIGKMTKLRQRIANGARARREEVARGFGDRAARDKTKADQAKAKLDEELRQAGGDTTKVPNYDARRQKIDRRYARASRYAKRGTKRMESLALSDAKRAAKTKSTKRRTQLERRAALTFDGAAGIGILRGEIQIDQAAKTNGGTSLTTMPRALGDAPATKDEPSGALKLIDDAEKIHPPIVNEDSHRALRTGVRETRRRHYEAVTIELGYFEAGAPGKPTQPTKAATLARRAFFEEGGKLMNELDDRIALLEAKGAAANPVERETLADLRVRRADLKTARAEIGASSIQGDDGVAAARANHWNTLLERDGASLQGVDIELTILDGKARAGTMTAAEGERRAMLRHWRGRLKDAPDGRQKGLDARIADAKKAYDQTKPGDGAKRTFAKRTLETLEARKKQLDTARVTTPEQHAVNVERAGARHDAAKANSVAAAKRLRDLDARVHGSLDVSSPEHAALVKQRDAAKAELGKLDGVRRARAHDLVVAYQGTPSTKNAKAARDAAANEAKLRDADAVLASKAFSATRVRADGSAREDLTRTVDPKTNIDAADGDRAKVRAFYGKAYASIPATTPKGAAELKRLQTKEAHFSFGDARYLARSTELLSVGREPSFDPRSAFGRVRMARLSLAHQSLGRGEDLRNNHLDGGDLGLSSQAVLAYGDIAATFATDRPNDVTLLLGVRPKGHPAGPKTNPGGLDVIAEVRAKYGDEAADGLSNYLGAKAAVARSRLAARPGAGVNFTNGHPDTRSLIDTFAAEKTIANQIVDPELFEQRSHEIRDFATQLDLVGAMFQTVERDLVAGGALFGVNLGDLKTSLVQANDSAIEGLAELIPYWENSMNEDDDKLLGDAKSMALKDQRNTLRGVLLVHAGYNRLQTDSQRIEYIALMRHVALGPEGIAKAYGLPPKLARETFTNAANVFGGTYLKGLDPRSIDLGKDASGTSFAVSDGVSSNASDYVLVGQSFSYKGANGTTNVNYSLFDGLHGAMTGYLKQGSYDPRAYVGTGDANPVMTPRMGATVDTLGHFARDWAGTARWGGLAGNVATTAFYVLLPIPVGKLRAVGGAVKAWRGFKVLEAVPGMVQIGRGLNAVGRGAVGISRAVVSSRYGVATAKGLDTFRKARPILYAGTAGGAKMAAYMGGVLTVQAGAEHMFGKKAYATKVVRVLSEWIQPGAAIKVARLRNLAPQLLLAEGQLIAGQVVIPAVIKDPTLAKWTNFGLSILVPAGLGAGSVAARSRFSAKAMTAAAFPTAPKAGTPQSLAYQKRLTKEIAAWMALGGGAPRSGQAFKDYTTKLREIGKTHGVDPQLTDGFVRSQAIEWAVELETTQKLPKFTKDNPATAADGRALVDATAARLVEAGFSPAEAYTYAGSVVVQKLGAVGDVSVRDAAVAGAEHAIANQWTHGLDAARVAAGNKPLDPAVRDGVATVTREFFAKHRADAESGRVDDAKHIEAYTAALKAKGLGTAEVNGLRTLETHRVARIAIDGRIAKLPVDADTPATRQRIAREEAARVLGTNQTKADAVVALADSILAGAEPPRRVDHAPPPPADPEGRLVSALGRDHFMKVFGDNGVVSFDGRRLLGDAEPHLDALSKMAKDRPQDARRLLDALSLDGAPLIRRAVRDHGPEVALKLADVTQASPRGLRYLRSLDGDDTILAAAKQDPAKLAAAARSAEAKIFMRATDGTWLMKGPPPATAPKPSAAEMRALANRAGVDPAILANPGANPKAVAKMVAQMKKEMGPDATKVLELELQGRRFVDHEHYREARTAGVANPEHRYGRVNFEGWQKADRIIAEAAANGRPLTTDLLIKAHKAASKDILPPRRQGALRAGPKDAVHQGGEGALGQQRVSPEEFKALRENPHLDVADLGVHDGKHLVIVQYLEPAKVRGALDTALARIDERLAAGEDPVVVAADAQREVVSIHPFFDGNGRTSRLVMDYVLKRAGIEPGVVRNPNLDTSLSKQAWRGEVRDGLRRPFEATVRAWSRARTETPGGATPTSGRPTRGLRSGGAHRPSSPEAKKPAAGHERVDTNEVRDTLGWSGTPTATPVRGQEHLGVIHRGLGRMPAERRAKLNRLLAVIESPPPALSKKRTALSNRLTELSSGENKRLLNTADHMLTADQRAQKAKLNDEFTRVVEGIDRIDQQYAGIKRAAVREMSEFRRELAIVPRADAGQRAKALKVADSAKRAASEADLRGWAEDFFRFVPFDMQPGRIELRFTDDRAHALRGGELNVGKEPHKAITWHELGHFIEFRSNATVKAAAAWVHARSKQANGGVLKEGSLRDITGADVYKSTERAYEDHFVSPYVGKKYASETEVVSVGMEYFSSPTKMLDLYRRDPEHFFFMVGVLSP